jgi:hypothetical protein
MLVISINIDNYALTLSPPRVKYVQFDYSVSFCSQTYIATFNVSHHGHPWSLHINILSYIVTL